MKDIIEVATNLEEMKIKLLEITKTYSSQELSNVLDNIKKSITFGN